MILDITQDPQWLEQRNKLWLELERNVSEDLTRKEVKNIKDFFFTGIASKNSWIKAIGMLDYFPVFTVEGIAWCLQNQVDASLSDDDFQSIQAVFGLLHNVPGLSCEEQVSCLNMYLVNTTIRIDYFRSCWVMQRNTGQLPCTSI
jgi:hypothetical protein